MIKPVITVIFIIFLIYCLRNFVLFPYVSKSLNQANTIENGNILIRNSIEDSITVFFPGNATSVYNMIPYLKPNTNYLLINYRSLQSDGYYYGYSRCDLAIRNGVVGYAFACNNFKEVKVVTFSIGNGVFAETLKLTEVNPHSLTSISGLPNLSELKKNYFGYYSYLITWIFDEFETCDIFAKYLNCPHKIVHGTLDRIIPVKLIEEMYTILKTNNKNVTLELKEKYSHNDISLIEYL